MRASFLLSLVIAVAVLAVGFAVAELVSSLLTGAAGVLDGVSELPGY